MTIDDSTFDRVVTLREAYLVMQRFVADHLGRGEVPTGLFLAYFGLASDRRPGDLGALDDYLAAVAEVLPTPADAPVDASCSPRPSRARCVTSGVSQPRGPAMPFEFTAVYQRAAEGGYVAFVPELPGANTQGETLEQARANLREAVALVLEANRALAEADLAEAGAGAEVIREPLALSA